MDDYRLPRGDPQVHLPEPVQRTLLAEYRPGIDLNTVAPVLETNPTDGIDPFLQPGPSFDVATEAYRTALEALHSTLDAGELDSVQSTRSVADLYTVATQAQNACARSRSGGGLQRLVEVLHHYSPILDILSQSHADYTALLWGSIKWLLQIAMNYFKLLRRFSTMLQEIGENLPRFMLYERILSTNHMSRVISKLYSAIIEFLHEAIAFWKRCKLRKLLVAFWTPFEVRFTDTLQKIHRLQECVEKDAAATEIAQRRMESVRYGNQLQELSLVTKHTLQTILEVKERQTFMLLMNLRQQMFTSFDCKSEYQEECIKVYSSFVSDEWQETMRIEAGFSSWNHVPQSRLTYVQLEASEPVLAVGQLLYDSKAFASVRRVMLFWGPSMTRESALAALIFGILTKHAEKLLYRQESCFYAEKLSRCSKSFDQLWAVFLEIMSILPELVCTISVASYEPEATWFVSKLVHFALHSRHRKLDLLIYHPTVKALSATPGWIELDNDYDVDYDLNACDSFFRLVLLEANYYGGLSETTHTYIWMTTWRVLRYDLMSLTYHRVCDMMRPDVKLPDGIRPVGSFSDEGVKHRQAATLLKRRIIAFLQFIPMHMSTDVWHQLQDAFSNRKKQASHLCISTSNAIKIISSKEERQPVPLNRQQRAEICLNIQMQFDDFISEVFEGKISNLLADSPHFGGYHRSHEFNDVDNFGQAIKMDLVGTHIFSQDVWSVEETSWAQSKMTQVMVSAIETGLTLTQQMVYPVNSGAIVRQSEQGIVFG